MRVNGWRRRSAVAALALIAGALRADVPAVTLQVSVRGRTVPLKELVVRVQSEHGEGVRLSGSLSLFSLPLEAGRSYLLQFECAACITEQIMVDARLPADAANGPWIFPVSVVMEKSNGPALAFAAPVGWIMYREDIRDLGYVEVNDRTVPQVLSALMATFSTSGSHAIREVAFVWPRAVEHKRKPRSGRVWLNELLEDCGRDDAAYSLTKGRMEDGHWVGYIRSMQGPLKAIGHYADRDLRTRHGDFTFYYADGSIECAGQYAHGVKCGLWRRYGPGGRELGERVYDPRPLAEVLLTIREHTDKVPDDGKATQARNVAVPTSRRAGMVHRLETVPGTAALHRPYQTMSEHERPCTTDDGGQQLSVERLRVTTIVHAVEEGVPVEYRRVSTYYGAVHHFRNGLICSELEYDRGVLH